MNFTKVKSLRIYETVISQLKEKIAQGELAPGDMLPPERELASLMGVSRASVREALTVLQFMQLIESRPGGGTFVSSKLQQNQLVEKLNSIAPAENGNILLDLLELREVLEPRIVELAVARASEEEIEKIEKSFEMLYADLDENEDENEEGRSFSDVIFHLAIASASHNMVFAGLLETMLSMIEETRYQTLLISRKPGEIREEHAQILKNIKNRDILGAKKAMITHLHNICKLLKKPN